MYDYDENNSANFIPLEDDPEGYDDYDDYDEPDLEEPYVDPVQADAYVLFSAGMGTDEDYGYYGNGEDW